MPRKPAPRRVKPTPERAAVIYDRLAEHYPNAHCALDFSSPFQLLIATILSAQCTDKRVNMVTPALFARYPTPAALAAANPDELEEIIKSDRLLPQQDEESHRHGHRASPNGTADAFPRPWTRSWTLPGVGRKTANVILGNAFDKNEGVVVDTHVSRVTQRLGLTKRNRPGEDRAGSREALSARQLDDALASAHRAWPADLRRAPAEVRDMFPQRSLPVVAGIARNTRPLDS